MYPTLHGRGRVGEKEGAEGGEEGREASSGGEDGGGESESETEEQVECGEEERETNGREEEEREVGGRGVLVRVGAVRSIRRRSEEGEGEDTEDDARGGSSWASPEG